MIADSLGLIGLPGLVVRELMLFAAVGFVVFGIGDFAIDLVWLVRGAWRRAFILPRVGRGDAAGLVAARPGTIAIFVPAWNEATVIGAMVRNALATLPDGDWHIQVGAYPNDPATIAAVEAIDDDRVRLTIGDRPGPTTKADCLNTLWHALLAQENRRGRRVKAIVLHDAEDVIHPNEPALFDAMIERFAMVQIPVLPLPEPRSRWVAGHYLDEFAESHGKTLVVREVLGAGIPAAGVGCAFERTMLGEIAAARGGNPFDADSLTEDYEIGLRIAERGGRAAFVRIAATPGGPLVAVRAHFPQDLGAAVRQKSRWIAGIALSGWDRMGWRGGFVETWMRLDDRRPPLAALVTLAAYAALLGNVVLATTERVMGVVLLPPLGDAMRTLIAVCSFLLVWRLAMRAWLVGRAYGPIEALRSIPRAVVGNIIAMMATRRALGVYRRARRDGVVRWDKTDHRFPANWPEERRAS